MKSSVNGKIIAITGIVLILTALILFRNREKTVFPSSEKKEKSEHHLSSPAKENVSPSLLIRIELLKKKVAANPNDVYSIKSLAQLLMDSHKPDEAIFYFNKGLERQPTNDSLLLDLAVCYFNLKKYGKAMEATEKILKRNTKHSTALLNKGIILAVQNKNDSAKVVFKRVVSIAPNSNEAKQAEGFLVQLRKQQ